MKLKHKLIGASLLAVVITASALTWLASSQLFEQTRNGLKVSPRQLQQGSLIGFLSKLKSLMQLMITPKKMTLFHFYS